jgi:hypothetical protein
MSSAVLDDVDIDPNLLRELDDLEGRVDCSFSGCEIPAVSLLKCPCGIGSETMCGPHTLYVRMWQESEAKGDTIVFDKSCLHTPPVKECAIVPLGA